MTNFYELVFKTEKWNNIWESSNENEFKIEGRNIKEIKEEINFQRKLKENTLLSTDFEENLTSNPNSETYQE